MTHDKDRASVAEPRRLFMVLSPRALGYAKYAIESLRSNAIEPIHLSLITDSMSDKDVLKGEMDKWWVPTPSHSWSVYTNHDLLEREAAEFARYPNLRLFRNGHPCWRKVTDPLLLSDRGSEIVILDPDLYFPNRFCFEHTPAEGVLLMWQKPNCLLPSSMVWETFKSGIALAHHVDIGVAQWRRPMDLDWLEWLLGRLRIASNAEIRHVMHVEAIVWSALAMRLGGGYLPRSHWHCWQRNQFKRGLMKLGVPGPQLLRLEPFSRMKCFHAGGNAKYWLEHGKHRGWLDHGRSLNRPGPITPFERLTPSFYGREQRAKRILKNFGYYRVFPA